MKKTLKVHTIAVILVFNYTFDTEAVWAISSNINNQHCGQ